VVAAQWFVYCSESDFSRSHILGNEAAGNGLLLYCKENHPVARITIIFGVFLIALGLVGYFGTHQASWTALIPAFVGLPLAALGGLALKESRRKHMMHAAVIVGLLGFIGAAGSFARPLSALLSGKEIERPIAAVMQGVMALTCAVFVGLCVKSFIDARRSRRAQKLD
jgi:lysylphosphatidylglycerol synthetase-like protein (DUF2156 family)